MSGEGVADDELAAFIDRILRMKDEADAIASDIKEIYAEAHGRGYNKTRLGEVVTKIRKRDKDADGEAEKEAIRDLYEEAYYRSKNKPHAYARARGGEITEQQSAPQAARDLTPPLPQGQVATHTPETAPSFADAGAHGAEANHPDSNAVASVPATKDGNANTGGQHEVPAHSGSVIFPGRLLSEPAPEVAQIGGEHQRTDNPETNEAPAGRVADESPAPKLIYAAPGIVTHEHTPPEPVKWHPYAQCFPTVLGDDLKALEQDIHASFGGVRDPIVKIGNLILDGRARYGIARAMLIDYPVKQYDGTDPLIDVIAWNLASRQERMSQAQMVTTAKALAKLEPSRADDIMQAFGLETAEAAQ